MSKKMKKLKKIGKAVGGLAVAGGLGYLGAKYGPQAVQAIGNIRKVPKIKNVSGASAASVTPKSGTAIKSVPYDSMPKSAVAKNIRPSKVGKLVKIAGAGGVLGALGTIAAKSSLVSSANAPYTYRRDYAKEHGIKESRLKSAKVAYRPVEPVDWEEAFGRKKRTPDTDAWNYEK